MKGKLYSDSELKLRNEGLKEIKKLDQQKIRTVSFPKEIAGIWFYKGEKYWNIKGSFHFNVVPPHLISSIMKFSFS